jgi:hypothetical protein
MEIIIKKSSFGSKHHNKTGELLPFSDKIAVYENGSSIDGNSKIRTTRTTRI